MIKGPGEAGRVYIIFLVVAFFRIGQVCIMGFRSGLSAGDLLVEFAIGLFEGGVVFLILVEEFGVFGEILLMRSVAAREVVWVLYGAMLDAVVLQRCGHVFIVDSQLQIFHIFEISGHSELPSFVLSHLFERFHVV